MAKRRTDRVGRRARRYSNQPLTSRTKSVEPDDIPLKTETCPETPSVSIALLARTIPDRKLIVLVPGRELPAG